MKRAIIVFAILAMLVASAEARRRREPAGTISNMTYQDNSFGFQLKLSDNWSTKVRNADDNFRLVMMQKKYGTPARYSNAPDYTQIPRIVVYADTSSLSATALLDSILSPTYKSKQKRDVLKEFDLLAQPDLVPRDKRIVTLDGETGVMWEASANYTKDISVSASSAAGMRVQGSYSGVIVAVKKDNTVVLFHMMCESDFFDPVVQEMMGIVNSLKWTSAKK
jgi:hypothetical protein